MNKFPTICFGLIGVHYLLFYPMVTQADNWGADNLWDDGKAEYATYDSERVVYGQVRQFEEVLITVKEDFRTDTLVKADRPDQVDTVRAFKLNIVQKFNTQNYPYSYLMSVFVKSDPLNNLLKISMGSQEYCGNTFKLLTTIGAMARLDQYSYFDGEAYLRQKIPLGDQIYFEDQLPISLRAWPFDVGFKKNIRLWTSLFHNRGKKLESEQALISVLMEEPVSSGKENIFCWKVEVKRKEKSDYYWIEKATPHILVKMVKSDGSKRVLKTRVRWSYWDRTQPPPPELK